VTSQPFHHGNLRAVLLERAEAVVRERGADALSLRELAREAGVSHGAPRSHFIDRQALLDALAVQGFDRLAERLRAARDEGRSFEERFHRIARAYVGFAVDDAALMELMFSMKTTASTPAVAEAAGRMFDVLGDALAEGSTTPPDAVDGERFGLVFAAAVQGAAALVTTGRVSREQGERIVDDAATMLLQSELGARVLGRGPGAR
jgi:AcrR family transcriptional regulator